MHQLFYSLTGNAWLTSGLSAIVAVGIALAIYQIVWIVARRLLHHVPIAVKLLGETRGPSRWLAVWLAMQFVWDAAPDNLPVIGAVRHATAIGLILALTWLSVRLVNVAAQGVIVLHPTQVKDNLQARRMQTQVLVISRTVSVFVLLIGLASALMTFPAVRQLGASLLASAGVAGLVVGLAARPMLGNIIAGMQIALTQPVRIDDVLVIDGEWGRVEEITTAFVVLNIWDERRLIIPLQYLIEHPFQNWTRTSAQIIGTVFLWLDYHTPIDPLRAELKRLCESAPEWDGRLAMLQVTEVSEKSIQVRALVTSTDSSRNWTLRCRVREGMIDFIRSRYPECLPKLRAQLEGQQDEATGLASSQQTTLRPAVQQPPGDPLPATPAPEPVP